MQVIYQNEVAECGYACLAMTLTHLGRATEVRELSAYRPISANGIDLTELYDVAVDFGLEVEAYRFGAEHLKEIKRGSIIHFGGAHFIVFDKYRRGRVYIIDPASGRRVIAESTFLASTTGYLLECKTTPSMSRIPAKSRVPAAIRRVLTLSPEIKGQVAKVMFAALGGQFAILASPYLGNLVLDQVVAGDNRNLLNILAFTFACIYLIGAFSDYISNYLTHLLHERTNVAVTESLLGRLLRNTLSYFEKRHVGDLFARLNAQKEINTYVTSTAVTLFMDSFVVVAAFLLMLVQSPMLTGIAVIFLAIYIGVSFALFPRMLDLNRRVVEQSARVDDAQIETIRAAQLIKLAQGESRRTSLFMVLYKSLASASLQSNRLSSLRDALLKLIQYADTIVITWLSATMMLEGKISVGVFYSFLIYKSLLSDRFAKVINRLFEFVMLNVPVARVDDVIEAPQERYTDLADAHKAVEVREFRSLEAHDISFRYGVSDQYVLKGVSLKINKGDKVAIIGPSGSGKSTLFKLFSAAESLQEGDLRMNDIGWANLSVDEIRRHGAHMRQGDIILHGSIADNVSLFAANADESRVHEVLKQVGLLDDVLRLPMRTRTIISDTIANISAGQRQRLLLARVLYQQKEVLFLDEPTSNLDPESVRHIADLIKGLSRTVIAITHDRTLAETFPVAYRMEDGALVPV